MGLSATNIRDRTPRRLVQAITTLHKPLVVRDLTIMILVLFTMSWERNKETFLISHDLYQISRCRSVNAPLLPGYWSQIYVASRVQLQEPFFCEGGCHSGEETGVQNMTLGEASSGSQIGSPEPGSPITSGVSAAVS